jgi:transposase-like protein
MLSGSTIVSISATVMLKIGTDKLMVRNCKNRRMNTYRRHRFPPDIISYAVWLYYRFNLSHRDIEDLLAERGIIVSRESIRLWCIKFGALYARRLKRKHRGYGDTFYIDEVFVKINGKQWTRTVKWSTCISRRSATGVLPN